MSDTDPQDRDDGDAEEAAGVDPASPARAVLDDDSEDLPEPSEPA